MTILEFATNIKNKISARLTEINAALVSKGQTECTDMMEVPAKIKAIETGITPVGSKSITSNGTHDVTAYASANVNVPVPSGYIKPSGTKDITANGSSIDVNSYQYANVNVPVPSGYVYPSGDKSITSNGSGIDVKNYSTVSVNVPVPSGYVYPSHTVTSREVYMSEGDEYYSFSSGTYLPYGCIIWAPQVSIHHVWFDDMNGAYSKNQCRFYDITEDDFNRLQFLIIRGYGGEDMMDLYDNGRIMYAMVHVKEGYMSTMQGKNQNAIDDKASVHLNNQDFYASEGDFSITYNTNGYVRLYMSSNDYCWFDTNLTYVVEGIVTS